MKLKNVLNEDMISIDLKGTEKQEIIEELLDILMRSGKVKDRDEALKALLEREEKMSTGIQYGVAIPHAKVAGVTELAACIGIKPEGVDFASLDGEPSRIFIMTLSSVNRTGPHVQFLAEISNVLKSKAVRQELIEAESKKEVLKIFGVS